MSSLSLVLIQTIWEETRDLHNRWGLQPPSTTWLVGENILQEEVHMANSDTSRKLKTQYNK